MFVSIPYGSTVPAGGLIKVLGEKMVLHDGARCMLLWDMLAETLVRVCVCVCVCVCVRA
jgi:hypothetical protein